ncbi:MAG: hypothetical protein CMF23_13400 [Ignavibacteriae bacterium]|nr:hypothetical protein [Ignavibacteriota bacterium]
MIKEIHDKIIVGKAGLEKDELENLLSDLAVELNNFSVNNESSELLIQITEIFDAIRINDFRSEFFSIINKKLVLQFGEVLAKLTLEEKNPLIHSFLDLIRYNDFLNSIYKEAIWEELILTLILASNYSIKNLYEQRLQTTPNKVWIRLIEGHKTHNITWTQADKEIRKISAALNNHLNNGNDKTALLMDNGLSTIYVDLACLLTGKVNVIIPANAVREHIRFILNQTKAKLIFVSDEKQLQKIKSIKKDLMFLEKVILVNGFSSENWVTNINDFIKENNKNESLINIDVTSTATIMYTSGTTGEPKGIVFSHLNIIYKRFCRALAIPLLGDEDRLLCYLPLYHTFGRYLEMTGSMFWNAEYIFMENPSMSTMISNMQLVKPTVFISIPKKWMQIYEYITSTVDIQLDSEEKILEAVKKATGGELKIGLSAAGYLPSEVFRFFQRNGIELISGFGMTEATGGITMTPLYEYRDNSLGKPLPGIKIKVADDGELLIKGKYVMEDYYNQPHEETFDEEGWLPTGDIMKMDEDGFIEIIDRKKEIYKNIKGETVAPQKIENLFRDFDFVKQVFLVGDHRPFNTLLIFPNYEEDSILTGMTNEQKRDYFASTIVTVNKFLAPFERIVDFRLIERPFAEKEGELTPKGTYKRRVIENNFDEIIEEMYKKNYIDFYIQETDVRIPNWFMREKGLLSGDFNSSKDKITIPKLDLLLSIKKIKENYYQVGDYVYKIKLPFIDLQDFLINPNLWLGNKELYEFSSSSLIQWTREHSANEHVKFIYPSGSIETNEEDLITLSKLHSSKEFSLEGLNLGITILHSTKLADAEKALAYIKEFYGDLVNSNINYLESIIKNYSISSLIEIKREQIILLSNKLKDEELRPVLKEFLKNNYNLLNKKLISHLGSFNKPHSFLIVYENILKDLLKEVHDQSDEFFEMIDNLLNLIVEYGSHHPTSYEHIRQTLVKYQLQDENKILSSLSKKWRAELRFNFRKWLGENEQVAVDTETGEEYTWKDVIILDEMIEREDQDILIDAISNTCLLREAIFLFSKGKIVRLHNILPGGIWVSPLRKYHDKSVYRVSIQTHQLGSFDVVLNLNKKLDKDKVREEINWLILAGSRHFVQEFIEDFGAYWEEHDLWTSKFVPGDTVDKLILRESKKGVEYQNRLNTLWSFFVWNASAAYFNFWRLTNFKLMLKDSSPNNFIIPPHDYQTGTKVVSFSERDTFTNLKSLFYNLYFGFVAKVENQYEFIKNNQIVNYIFAGIINAEGEEIGKLVLQELLDELKNDHEFVESKAISEKLENFMQRIEDVGFLPKQLYFSIKRYHRWLELNNDPTLQAQAEMLNDLYNTYQLFELEPAFPAVRTRFYLETVFAYSNKLLREEFHQIIIKQKNKKLTRDQLLDNLSSIQSQYTLDEKEKYFLTRLSYPHLKPSDSAVILRTKDDDNKEPNLVVQYIDTEGKNFYVRKPISPKEISKLHQIFIEANLSVNFNPDHHFLVAISDRGFLVGGLFYKEVDENTIFMDKIVVDNRFRRKGISESLMKELFNRIKTQNYKFVTTGFFRPEYFYKFGFKIERKYSGLVKVLDVEIK